MKKIPLGLVYSRAIIALIILFLTIYPIQNNNLVIALLIVVGLLTDVFDGIIARKLNVATEHLRVLDSNVDQFFWGIVIVSVFYLRYELVEPLGYHILVLLTLESVAYIVSFIKFKKPIATHSWLAKLWSITLLVFLVELILYSTVYSFMACFVLGVVSRIEIIGIIFLLNKWQTDVSSIFMVKGINEKVT